jgi:hypothetical protein
MMHRETGDDRVERGVGIRQVFGHPLLERYVGGPFPTGRGASLGQHLGVMSRATTCPTWGETARDRRPVPAATSSTSELDSRSREATTNFR